MRLARWPARSQSSGGGAVCVGRRARADGAGADAEEVAQFFVGPAEPDQIETANVRSISSIPIDAAGSSQPRGDRHRPPACLDLDEADGDRGAPWIMMRSATDLSKADLHVFSKLFDDGLERGQEAKAFSWRQIGGHDDVLDFFVGHLINVEMTRQPAP